MSLVTMDRLPFTLPDFTRLMWVSDAAQEVWAPRLRAITRAWHVVEWRAVVAGIRACTVTVLSPESLPARSAAWLDEGLITLPLEVQGVTQAYASTPVPHEPGQPSVLRVVAGRPDDVRAFRAAWMAADESAVGQLLGYPPCCTGFFRHVWVTEEMVDTTWPMAVATSGISDDSRTRTVSGPPEANVLWRWMGVRAVPHLPCQFDCVPTVALGQRLLELGRAIGHAVEMAWLLEILRWPVEWSALHGIAEVRTPVLKVSTRTDATAVAYVVRFEGETYPAEGVRGLRFPYRAPARLRLTDGRPFRRGFDQALPAETPRPSEAPLNSARERSHG